MLFAAKIEGDDCLNVFIIDTLAPNLTLSPSSIELARMETELLTEPIPCRY